MHLSAEQIKAARAILGWSQDELATASGLSAATVYNLEKGNVSPRSINEIRKACEDAGLEFIDHDGVKRCADEVRIYQGPNSCDKFFEDVLQTVREKNGEIVAISKSQKMLTRSLGIFDDANLDRLQQLSEFGDVKCLVSEAHKFLRPFPSFQFRIIPNYNIGPLSYFVYGDKQAVVLAENNGTFRFIVFRTAGLARAYRCDFHSLWSNALPLTVQAETNKQCARA